MCYVTKMFQSQFTGILLTFSQLSCDKPLGNGTSVWCVFDILTYARPPLSIRMSLKDLLLENGRSYIFTFLSLPLK